MAAVKGMVLIIVVMRVTNKLLLMVISMVVIVQVGKVGGLRFSCVWSQC